MVSKFALSLHDVTVKRRGKTILGPVTLDLAEQGFTIVLGPNGAGKTTFLKAMHGIERLSAGRVEWPVSESDARRQQSYVFQTPTMLRRTVAANLAYPLELLKVPKAEIADSVQTWAAAIGLEGALKRPATRLSGGERQKLAVGRALIRNPKVLFLDEPCANLDGRATREIEALLRNANEAGTRIIMTIHNFGQARRLASDILFLLSGKIHEQGSAKSFLDGPTTPEARAFLQGDIVE